MRYAFWSLGHCYSPEMDYKRQLGHRIYTRAEFRALLQRHRGPFVREGLPEGALRAQDQVHPATFFSPGPWLPSPDFSIGRSAPNSQIFCLWVQPERMQTVRVFAKNPAPEPKAFEGGRLEAKRKVS